MALKYEELTRLIIECIFEVHNDVGVGLDEETYHQSLFDCFSDKGVPAISKERKHLIHRGIEIRRFELDLLRAELDYQKIVYRKNPSIQVKYRDKLIRTCTAKALCIADQILCGVTAIQNQISLFDVARMRTYLRHSNIPIGLLVNFGKSNLEIKALHH